MWQTLVSKKYKVNGRDNKKQPKSFIFIVIPQQKYSWGAVVGVNNLASFRVGGVLQQYKLMDLIDKLRDYNLG